MRSSATTWVRLLARKGETSPPEPTTWLTKNEAVIFTGRCIEHLERVPTLRTRRERDGRDRVTVFFDAEELAKVFRVSNSRTKLVLLDCTRGQLEREFKTCTDPELFKWIGQLLV